MTELDMALEYEEMEFIAADERRYIGRATSHPGDCAAHLTAGEWAPFTRLVMRKRKRGRTWRASE